MHPLVPACHVGVISALEQPKIIASLETIFSGPRDRWFIAPICSVCHHRFADLNQTDFGHMPDFELL